MNWLLIAVIVILLLAAFNGYRKGFIKTVFSLFSLIIALLLSYWISPIISKGLQNNEKVMDYFTGKVEDVLHFDNSDVKTKDQEKAINDLPLPEAIKKSLSKHNSKDIYSALNVSNFKEYITRSVACFVLNAIVYIATFLVLIILLQILCFVLNLISYLPVLNGVNHLAGLLVGILQGLILLWIGCVIVTACSSTEWGREAFIMIKDSKFLSFLYDNNLLLKYVTNLSKLLL